MSERDNIQALKDARTRRQQAYRGSLDAESANALRVLPSVTDLGASYRIFGQLSKTMENMPRYGTSLAKLVSETDTLATHFKNISESIDFLEQRNGASGGRKTLLEQQTEATMELIKKIDSLVNNRPLPEPIIPGAKALGGPIYGKDTIPAMLSPGEFVINAQAARQFYGTLVGINSGIRGFAQGGPVHNVTTGDLNVTVQSSGNAQVDAVSIGNALRREIRRGRLSWN
jgi:hypothetical protein